MKFMHTVNNKGLSLVVVMLIILAASAVALVSLKTTQTDNKMVTAFQYNRQAASAAHQSAGFVINDAKDPLKAVQNAAQEDSNAVSDAIKSGAKEGVVSNSWIDLTKIGEYTGLSMSYPGSGEGDGKRLLGDLARPVLQHGSIGDSSLDDTPIAGFSDADEFCSYTRSANSYAVIGRSIPLRKDGENRYYLLADLNSRTAAYKREMGLLRQKPMSCKQ